MFPEPKRRLQRDWDGNSVRERGGAGMEETEARRPAGCGAARRKRLDQPPRNVTTAASQRVEKRDYIFWNTAYRIVHSCASVLGISPS